MFEYFKYLCGVAGPSGYSSKTTAEQVTNDIALKGRTAIVTGATSGIGMETARVLAKRGAHVILAVRNLTKAEEVKAKILKEIPGASLEVGELDLSSLDSVRNFAAAFKSKNQALHILINNAGLVSAKFLLTKDGQELTWAVNHLGHFLLTELLVENLIATAENTGLEGRIVLVSSVGYRLLFKGETIIFDEINDPRKYEYRNAYGLSKLAMILYGMELARRLQEKGANVTVNSLHPGAIVTDIARDFIPNWLKAVVKAVLAPFVKSYAQGAATTLYVATSPALKGVSGKYFSDCNQEETVTPVSRDMKQAAELWEFCNKLTSA